MKLSLNEQGWNRLFIILNGTFLVYSLVLCGLSIKVQDDLSQFNEILQRISPSIIPVIIFTGLIGIIAAITGYCKILKQNQIITILHIISLAIATVTELCIAIGTIMTPNEFYTKANSSLQNSLHYYEQHPVYTEQFNHLQENYKCCGSLLFTDYRRTNNSLPVSCKDDKFIYAVGCTEALNKHVYKYIDPILALCFIFSIIKSIYLLIIIWMIHRSSNGKDPYTLECC